MLSGRSNASRLSMACNENHCANCDHTEMSNDIWTECPLCGSTFVSWVHDEDFTLNEILLEDALDIPHYGD